ncbi:MAG: ExbD/TolR family protein [Arenicella sp.]
MKFTDSDTEESSLIELTPLIDVVFLLLIFFMVTTTFTKESEIKIRLPEANAEELKADIESQVEILVSKDSAYAIRKPGQKEVVSLVNSARETLLRSLSEFQDNSDVLLVIRADKEATHQAVVNVMDVARDLKMTRITFATQNQ